MDLGVVAAVVAVLAALLVVRSEVASVTVFEFERGLRFRRGRFAGVVPPGLYWYMRRFTRIQKVDARPTHVTVPGQEVLSADGVAVKASVSAIYQVADPERAILGTDNFQTAVYSEVQLALRTAISSLPVEELLEKRADLSAQLKAAAAGNLKVLGVDLLDAAIRDITFPGELKKIFSQVVKARQEGLAALEKARGETAALRNLANAAQLVERNPQLMQLRLLQVLSQQPGNTVVLGVQSPGTPIPLREGGQGELPGAAGPKTDE
jgi:regulator of protease activity HflC (stomatin/prohibitin superfamily)